MGNKKTACEPRTAVAYARYSSAGQRDVSIEQQLRDIRAYAERNGFMLIREYADHAKSGFKNTKARTEFQRMMKDAENGAFDTVIAWKVDRFGRSREDSSIYKGRLRRHGVSVVYAMEPIPDGAAGVLMEGMLEATAEWYSRNLSENVTRGMRDNASRCMWNGTRILGYRRSPDGHFQIEPDEAAIVREIFSQYLQGESCESIGRSLQARGLRTVRHASWSCGIVKRVLKNERYAGTYIWGDFRQEDAIPAIVSKSEWKEVQNAMANSRRVLRKDGAPEFILTGKLFCGHCGASMIGDSGTGKHGERHYYYACLNRKNHRTCDKKNIRKDYIEDKLISFLVDQVLTEDVIEHLADAVMAEEAERKKASPIPGMENELADVNRQLKNINLGIANGVWSSSTVAMLKSLEEQADDLRRAIAQQRAIERDFTDRETILFFFHRFLGKDRNDPRIRAQLIQTFVNAVYVYDDHLRLFVNTVEGAATLPFDALPPEDSSPSAGSSCLLHGVLRENRSNPVVEFRIAI
jgi:DNA invertase Pin-like site-specific DNA recombinase